MQTKFDKLDPAPSKRKGTKHTGDYFKKLKLKDIKKLKQFSPYFVNLLKSQSKLSTLSKNMDFLDNKR